MSQKFYVAITMLISAGLIWTVLSPSSKPQSDGNTNVVRVENGVQYISVFARGGYSPNQIEAKANIPTVIEVETKGTYDCSAALTIPQLNYQEFLPSSGVTEIKVPAERAVNSLNLLCSMGMYGATINFTP